MNLKPFCFARVTQLYDYARIYKIGNMLISSEYVKEHFKDPKFYHFYIDEVEQKVAVRFLKHQDVDGLYVGKRLPVITKSSKTFNFSIVAILSHFNLKALKTHHIKFEIDGEYLIVDLSSLKK